MESIVSRTLSIGQEHELLQKLEAAGLNEQDAQKVIDSRKNELAKGLVALIREYDQVVEGSYPLTVNYDQSLEQMIAAGRYDWKNDDIKPKHFPVKGEGKVNVEITFVHHNRVMSTDDVLKDLDTRGLRPIKIEELLALGAAKPELQQEFPIIALGSVWQSGDVNRYCPGLDGLGSTRYIYLDWINYNWSSPCRFGAVRK